MKHEFVSIGEILIDFTPAGKSGEGAALFQQNLGGAPANIACAISKLGRSSAFIGMAGEDGFGRFCKDEMRTRGVDVKGLKLSKSKNTTLAFIHHSETGDRSFSFYRKNSADVGLGIDDLDMDIVRNAGIFHFGSVSLSDEPSRSATLHAVKEAKKSGSLISFDPNLRLNLWESGAEMKTVAMNALPYADIVKLSDDEVSFIFGANDFAAAIKHIASRFGIKLVIMTRGARGAMTVVNGRVFEQPAYGVDTIDTTGAGDCFFAGALHCFLGFGKPADALGTDEISRMLAFANASGSLACTKMGAVSSLPSIDEIENCMKNVKTIPI
jgi:sugar/nucleoside kinase (ribokinase family)